MFGDNPKRSVIFGDGTELEIKKIFKTIQGEGPHSGEPSIFIRLGGCNLACKFCDTEFEDFFCQKTKEIVDKVLSLAGGSIKLVVITGGEPLRQPIGLLCEKLIKAEKEVQIETNGTLYRELPAEVRIICSPKASGGAYSRIREDLLPKLSAIKFLVSKNILKYSSVAEIGQGDYFIPTFIQPMDQFDEKLNKENIELAIEICMKYGYNLSLQIHKIIGME